MPVYMLNHTHAFPPAHKANRDGILAIGGDLHPGRILNAYANGIFPWYSEGEPLLWWSPNPRMVLLPENFIVSKSMRLLVGKAHYEIRIDTTFAEVIAACKSVERKQQSGTWITDELADAFIHLHSMGYTHSFETFLDGKLVGGLYGLSLGGAFFGESMFHYEPNASKFALYHLVHFAQKNGIEMIDAQQETQHMASMGAIPMKRDNFLKRLKQLVSKPGKTGNWGEFMK